MKRRYLLSFFFVSGILMAHPFKQGDMVMDVRKSDVSEGTDIIMYSPHGGDNQNFIYENGNIKLASNQNYCVDVSRNPNYKENSIILWTCNGGNNQKFTITDGTIRPRDRANECITVKSEGFLKSEQCVSSLQQRFDIPKVCTYKDAYYRNMTECADSDIPMVKDNDTLSSLSVVNSSGSMFEHRDFKGGKVRFDKNIPFIDDVKKGFNDKVSSLKISSGKIFLITSDPQLVCTGNCGGISADTSTGNISAQYDMFNKYYPYASAVIINGDLTDYGKNYQWDKFKSLVGQLKIPYYYGLGNHEMYNTLRDFEGSGSGCYENHCIIRSITSLFHHVNNSNNIADFDVNYTHGYEFPEVRETIKGTLSYSVDFGDVLVIQLNDYENGEKNGKKKNPLKINQYTSGAPEALDIGLMRYVIDRNQDAEYSWLERQLYSAYKNKQVVIVNQHRPNADAGNLKKLLDKYNVQLRFAGHYHNGIGEKWSSGFRLSGSSALGTYLKVDVDTSKKTAKVYKGVNNTATPELIETISLEPPKGNITPPPPGPVYLRVKTSGGYEAFVSLVYRTKDGQQKKINSGKLLAGNSWEYNVPGGSTIEYLEARNNTGLAWEPQRRIFRVNNIRNDACFSTWGTTLNSAWQQVSCR
ncbi:ricin-type beta-trefoil lectin domain protein [Escherichia coli]|uniref:ricin-type beta-trefoil lectin domain protein n=1 Tax=Escherichia coli TaxID=562 RepID=UPI000CFDB2F1|nr:ricin-type beta-trefoil lectin domain protein [Escherichia coli]